VYGSMRRAIYTEEDERLRRLYLVQFTKYCADCDSVALTNHKRKYCDKCKKERQLNQRKNKSDYTPKEWQKKSDYWLVKNNRVNRVFRIAREKFPSLTNNKPEGITDCAHRWSVWRTMIKLSPNLRSKL